jgi:hypothetical protein
MGRSRDTQSYLAKVPPGIQFPRGLHRVFMIAGLFLYQSTLFLGKEVTLENISGQDISEQVRGLETRGRLNVWQKMNIRGEFLKHTCNLGGVGESKRSGGRSFDRVEIASTPKLMFEFK